MIHATPPLRRRCAALMVSWTVCVSFTVCSLTRSYIRYQPPLNLHVRKDWTLYEKGIFRGPLTWSWPTSALPPKKNQARFLVRIHEMPGTTTGVLRLCNWYTCQSISRQQSIKSSFSSWPLLLVVGRLDYARISFTSCVLLSCVPSDNV